MARPPERRTGGRIWAVRRPAERKYWEESQGAALARGDGFVQRPRRLLLPSKLSRSGWTLVQSKRLLRDAPKRCAGVVSMLTLRT